MIDVDDALAYAPPMEYFFEVDGILYSVPDYPEDRAYGNWLVSVKSDGCIRGGTWCCRNFITSRDWTEDEIDTWVATGEVPYNTTGEYRVKEESGVEATEDQKKFIIKAARDFAVESLEDAGHDSLAASEYIWEEYPEGLPESVHENLMDLWEQALTVFTRTVRGL